MNSMKQIGMLFISITISITIISIGLGNASYLSVITSPENIVDTEFAMVDTYDPLEEDFFWMSISGTGSSKTIQYRDGADCAGQTSVKITSPKPLVAFRVDCIESDVSGSTTPSKTLYTDYGVAMVASITKLSGCTVHLSGGTTPCRMDKVVNCSLSGTLGAIGGNDPILYGPYNHTLAILLLEDDDDDGEYTGYVTVSYTLEIWDRTAWDSSGVAPFRYFTFNYSAMMLGLNSTETGSTGSAGESMASVRFSIGGAEGSPKTLTVPEESNPRTAVVQITSSSRYVYLKADISARSLDDEPMGTMFDHGLAISMKVLPGIGYTIISQNPSGKYVNCDYDWIHRAGDVPAYDFPYNHIIALIDLGTPVSEGVYSAEVSVKFDISIHDVALATASTPSDFSYRNLFVEYLVISTADSTEGRS